MRRFFRSILVAIAFALIAPLAGAESFMALFPEIHAQIKDEYLPGIDAMDLQKGRIALTGGVAEVNIPDDYYFIGPKDARFVLEDLWRNPEDPAILGMIFPRSATPFDDVWGVVVTYDDAGYVSDDEAGTLDYDDLLSQLQEEAEAGNEERAKAGFPAMHLVGWAATPHYDSTARKLVWAKTLHFDGTAEDTLNYNIRALGRKGVLVVNFVATSGQLAAVEAAAPDVMQMVSFTEGNRYSDYIPDVDKVAAYGIGGLIAGSLASKTGVFVVLLAFLKKGFLLVLLPIAWIAAKLRKRRGGDDADPSAGS